MEENIPIAIIGPSGGGKQTLCYELIKEHPALFEVVGSYTTREPKEEKHGKQYKFVTREEFMKLLETGEILEYNHYTSTDLYGTSKKSYERIVASGKIPLLDIDINGVRQLKVLPGFEALFTIFLDNNLEELKRRLIARGAENAEKIERRLQAGKEELEQAPTWKQEGLINEIIWYGPGVSVEQGFEQILAIIMAARMARLD